MTDGCLAARIANFRNSFIFALLYAGIAIHCCFPALGSVLLAQASGLGGGFRDDSQAV